MNDTTGARIEVVEAERPEEIFQFFYASGKKLKKLVDPGKIGVIMCDCDHGNVCPNNPDKKLVGSFNLCQIQIK